MAIAAAPFLHLKKGEGGKKDEQNAAGAWDSPGFAISTLMPLLQQVFSNP
jgi:hypothetical protein